MQTTHAGSEWRCSLCDPDNYLCFASSDGLKTHLQTSHDPGNDFTESQLPVLVEKSLKRTPLVIENCPICIRPRETFGDAASMLSHIAEDLVEFALEALPWDGTFLDPSSDSGNSSRGFSDEAQLDADDQQYSIDESSELHDEDSTEDTLIGDVGEKRPLAQLGSITVSQYLNPPGSTNTVPPAETNVTYRA